MGGDKNSCGGKSSCGSKVSKEPKPGWESPGKKADKKGPKK
jgi:hypothetical protein